MHLALLHTVFVTVFGCRCIIFFYCWLRSWVSISERYHFKWNHDAATAVVWLRWHEYQRLYDVHVFFVC